MKKLIPLLFLAMVATAPTFAQRFFALNVHSKSIFYNVTDTINKTVSVIPNPQETYRGTVIVPNTVVHRGELYYVTSIQGTADGQEGAFAQCAALTSVTLPNSITTIEKGAFEDCEQLATFTLLSPKATIDGEAFLNCPALKKVVLGSNKVTFPETTFPKEATIEYKE